MELSLNKLIFYVEQPRVVGEFLSYVLDLELEAKNCDQYLLHNLHYERFPKTLFFKKADPKLNKTNDFEFSLVIAIENKEEWENHFKKIIFYLHQNGLNEIFSPSKEVRKPGGTSFDITLAPGVTLEFLNPLEVVRRSSVIDIHESNSKNKIQ